MFVIARTNCNKTSTQKHQIESLRNRYLIHKSHRFKSKLSQSFRSINQAVCSYTAIFETTKFRHLSNRRPQVNKAHSKDEEGDRCITKANDILCDALVAATEE